jgi:putative ABC transport system substrate-binding protein
MPPRPLCPAPLVPLALVVSLAVILAASSVEAQSAGGKTVRIGRLSPLSAEADRINMTAFRKGMTEHGWVEGKSFAIESRFADGQLDRLPALAAELVDQRVDLLLTGSNPGAMAAKKATSSIPIVMVTTGDPVAFGLITSLPRPGANLTGVTALGETLNAKRLELLKEAVPGVTRVAVLSHTGTPYAVDFQRARSAISRRLGLELPFFETESVGAMDGAFAAIAAERAAALMVLVDPFFLTHRRKIVALAAKGRLPAVYGEQEFVEDGGLMFYGASLVSMYREAAAYADKILKGAKPAEIPVEQPTKLDLVVNLKTAKALGITIPRAVLLRADRVVE